MAYYKSSQWVVKKLKENMKQTYKIIDTTTGNTLGYVDAKTERGAKSIAVAAFANAGFRFIIAIPVLNENI